MLTLKVQTRAGSILMTCVLNDKTYVVFLHKLKASYNIRGTCYVDGIFNVISNQAGTRLRGVWVTALVEEDGAHDGRRGAEATNC